jgi:hypothetical protein
VLLFFTGLGISRAENILTNGGFEDGTASWWGDGIKTGGVVADMPAEGANCLKITGSYVCQDKRPVEGGKNYRVSMKIRSEGAPEGSVYVQLSYRGGGLAPGWYGPANASVEGRTEKALFTTGGTQPWKEYSTVVTAPDGADQALLYLRKVPGSAGAAYFDDVRIEATEEPATPEAEVPEVKGNLVTNGGFES